MSRTHRRNKTERDGVKADVAERSKGYLGEGIRNRRAKKIFKNRRKKSVRQQEKGHADEI